MTLRRSLLIAALPLALLSACGKGASGHFEDARKAFAAEDFATARSELIAALEKEPADPAMRELQVRTLLRLGDGEGALTALARLKRNHPPAPVIIARYEAEAALLQLFAVHAGRPFSRTELCKRLNVALERSIDVQVTRLRRKIEEDPKLPLYLQTVRGVGYMLVPDRG